MEFHSKRRRGAGVTAIVVAVGLLATACGGQASPASAPSDEAKPEVLNYISLASPAYSECVNKVVGKFTADTGIKVNVSVQPYAGYHDKVLQNIAAGTGSVDAFHLPYEWVGEFAATGGLADLTGFTADDPVFTGIRESDRKLYEVDGKQLGLPYNQDAAMLWYRKDLLQKAGLQPPKTWDDYEKIAKTFTNNPAYPGITGTAVMGDRSQIFAGFESRYWGLGGDALVKDGKITLNKDITVKALDLLKTDLTKNAPAGALTAQNADVLGLFLTGQTAMVEAFGGSMGSKYRTEGADNKVFGNVGVSAVPGGKGQKTGWANAIAESSKYKASAYKLISYFSSPDGEDVCIKELGKSPIQEAAIKSLKTINPDADIYAAAGENGGSRPSTADSSKVLDSLATILSQYASGEISSVDDAANRMISATTAK